MTSTCARAPWLLVLVLLSARSPAAREQVTDDPTTAAGAAAYKTYCASCHGRRGRGDGFLVAQLGTRPADLTTLSRSNGGRFPYARVYEAIDGRSPIKAHGAMPAWGDALRDSPAGDDQARVKERISQLTRFVRSLQREGGATSRDSR